MNVFNTDLLEGLREGRSLMLFRDMFSVLSILFIRISCCVKNLLQCYPLPGRIHDIT